MSDTKTHLIVTSHGVEIGHADDEGKPAHENVSSNLVTLWSNNISVLPSLPEVMELPSNLSVASQVFPQLKHTIMSAASASYVDSAVHADLEGWDSDVVQTWRLRTKTIINAPEWASDGAEDEVSPDSILGQSMRLKPITDGEEGKTLLFKLYFNRDGQETEPVPEISEKLDKGFDTESESEGEEEEDDQEEGMDEDESFEDQKAEEAGE
jgi:hypothetical protein